MPFYILLNLAYLLFISGFVIDLITSTITQRIFFSNILFQAFTLNKYNILGVRTAANLVRNFPSNSSIVRGPKIVRRCRNNRFRTVLRVSIFRFIDRACVTLRLNQKARCSNISTNIRLGRLPRNWSKLPFNLVINILVANRYEEIWCFNIVRWSSRW